MKNFFASPTVGASTNSRMSLTAAISSTVARQLVASAVYFTSLWITTRALGPQQNGVLATMLLLPQTLFAFLNLGIGPSHVYHLSSGNGNQASMRRINWKLAAALWAGVLLMVALSRQEHIARVLPGIGKGEALLASMLFPIMLLAAWTSALIQGSRDYRNYNLTLLVQPFVYCGAVLVLYAFGAITPINVICCSILSQLCLWLLGEAQVGRMASPPVEKPHRLVDILRYGLRAHLSNVITYLNYRLALYLVSLQLGAAAVGAYALSVQLAEVFWLVSGAAAMIMFPESAAKGKTPAQLQKMIDQVALVVVLITGTGALIAGVLAPWAIPFVFGDRYTGSVDPFVILLPGIVLWSYMSVIANSLAGLGAQGVNMRGALLCLVINVVGDAIAIPHWGARGAALASTIAFSCTTLFTVLAYKKIMAARTLAAEP